MNNSNKAPKMEQVKHWINVQEKPSQKMGANTMNVKTAKIKLSKNWATNVEIYERVTKANLLSGFLRNAFPIRKLRTLLMTAEQKKAIVELKRINHVPPKIELKAEKSVVVGMIDTTQNIKQHNRLTKIANRFILKLALGPKCFVITSMHKNDNQLTKMPPSIASHSFS